MFVGYIYIITNLINDKVYIGKRTSSVFDNYYWGSGKILKKSYKKYGKNNFTRKIICWCKTLKELDEKEIYWIKWYRDNNFVCYNITNGGEGTYGYKHSEKTKQKFSNIHKGQIPWNKGKKWSDKIILKFKLSHKGIKKPWKQKKIICDGMTFDSFTDCCKYLNLKDTKHISRYLKNGKYKNHTLNFVKEVSRPDGK